MLSSYKGFDCDKDLYLVDQNLFLFNILTQDQEIGSWLTWQNYHNFEKDEQKYIKKNQNNIIVSTVHEEHCLEYS